MIDQISNFTTKSFKNYSTPSNFFKNINIIFGYNGRGKSSLSKGIIENYVLKGGNDNSFRFFNTDYVKDRLLLNEDGTAIKGVKVSFSKNDSDIARKIKDKENQIQDTTKDEEKASSDRANIRKQIDNFHNDKKGKANINRKQSKLTVEKVLEQYDDDLKSALKINSNKDFIKNFVPDTKQLELEKKTALNISLPNLNITKIPEADRNFLINSLGKSYSITDDIPKIEIIRWLENGVTLHDPSDSSCKFCHNSFNLQDVKDRILAYKQNSLQKDISKLENIKETLKNNIKNIRQAEKIKDNLRIVGMTEEDVSILFALKHLNDIENIIVKIDEKISNMHEIIVITDCILDFEREISDANYIINKARDKKISNLDSSIINMETLAKGAIAIAIQDSDIQEQLKSVTELEKNIVTAKSKNQKLRKEITDLENSKSEYTDFMDFLNEILLSLGIQIKLILENDKYYLKHTLEGVDLSINDISEGEKNLLALLYFYFELYKDKEQDDLLDEIELIVIDDPISSLDDSNKFYVLEIMKKLISEKNVQLFLLTHSWDDFCQMTYGIKTTNGDYGLFEIYKNPKENFQSEIRKCQQNIAPYKKLFLEIFELQNKSDEELSQCDVYHAANSMRRIFEEFLNFKKPNLLPQKSNQKQIEEIYKNATGEELGNNRKNKLGALLSFINVLSHRPIKSEEIIQNSRCLMRLIEDIDKVHFNEMKRT